MSLTLYSLHCEAQSSIERSWRECLYGDRSLAPWNPVCGSLIARVASAVAVVISSIKVVFLIPSMVGRVINICRDLGNQTSMCSAIVRIAVTVLGSSLLAVFRVAFSLFGCLSPEVVYGLGMHRVLLLIGLMLKVQQQRLYDRDLSFNSTVEDQRIRVRLTNIVYQRILQNENITGLGDGSRSWLRNTVQQEAGRSMPSEHILEDVRIVRPALRGFFDHFVEEVHRSALRVHTMGLYTKDEIEDLITAFPTVLNGALLDMISFRCGVDRGRVLYAGEPLTWAAFGSLSEWADQVRRIQEGYQRLSVQQREDIYYYLCSDEERVRSQRGAEMFPVPSRVQELFKEVVALRVGWLERHLGDDSQGLLNAFLIA